MHDIEEPTPTICASGRVNLVQATETYDILFRMLEPHELAAAMGFTTEEHAYEFAGTQDRADQADRQCRLGRQDESVRRRYHGGRGSEAPRGGRVPRGSGMSKLTKAQAKAHQEACDLLQKDVLTLDEKWFVLENWQESATT